MSIETDIKMEIFSKMIATALNIAVHQVENTLSLLNGGATIPFISRYRKEATGGLDEVQIGEIKERYDKLHRMIVKYEAGTLDFKPKCTVGLLRDQLDTMRHYLEVLEIRAEIENVDLFLTKGAWEE